MDVSSVVAVEEAQTRRVAGVAQSETDGRTVPVAGVTGTTAIFLEP